jgi:hypothetical protein
VRNASRQLRAKGLNGPAVTTLMKAEPSDDLRMVVGHANAKGFGFTGAGVHAINVLRVLRLHRGRVVVKPREGVSEAQHHQSRLRGHLC